MKRVEHALERGLFLSRWLMAPMYAGLSISLLLLLWVFAQESWHLFTHLTELTTNDAILGVLALIDLSLAANLVLIVVFSGYENFVSKFNDQTHEDRPDWQGTVDFSGLKLKLIASIVAISGIHLLKVFMDVSKTTPDQIKMMVVIHIVFVLSGVLLALMDWITVKSKISKSK
jgi:uncharacterized protein (TIGR00645 family)